MMRQLEQVFIEEVQERLLGQAESDQVMRNLQSEWDLREQMREMFASVSPEQYARWPIRPLVEAVLAGRKKVPAERQGAPQGRRPLLEDAARGAAEASAPLPPRPCWRPPGMAVPDQLAAMTAAH